MAHGYKNRIAMKFNLAQLERIIICLINNGFNKKFASNVKRLFGLFDPALYKSEYEKEVRVYLVNQIASIIINNNITQKENILDFLDTDGRYYNDCIEILNQLCEESVPDNELALLDKTISDQLKYSTIVEKAGSLSNMLVNLESENYDDLAVAVEELEGEIDTINREIKSARESLENAKKDLSLSSNGFVTVLDNIIKRERNPSTKVLTGIQYMNTMLNGGFEPGRVYCAMGVAKGWKSGFLLNCTSWAKRHNQLKAKNPALKPVVVYLSMENTNDETITRLWCHCFGNNSAIRDYEPGVAASMLESAGIFTPNDPNGAEILIWYRPNRSISTGDLNVMLEDLKKEGKECVFLVLDYLKRIRPVEQSKELRLELSNITNELKTIAMEHEIPILTAMQLNRDAFKALEDADSFEQKIRASDKLGASNVGESIDIIQNVDYAFIVNKLQNRGVNEDGSIAYLDRYLFIKLIACRSKQPLITSFKHRFKDDNDMAIIEDINLSRAISTISEESMIKDRLSNNPGKPGGGRKIVG